MLIYYYFPEYVSIMRPTTGGLVPIIHVASHSFVTIETPWVNRGKVGEHEKIADTCSPSSPVTGNAYNIMFNVRMHIDRDDCLSNLIDEYPKAC